MPVAKEIISEMQPINKVLLDDSNLYYIPDFQRSFVWGEEEIKQLISDFLEDTSEFSTETAELEGYLLGNIVLIDDETSGKKIVVDGQQRLTTMSLISKALYTAVMEIINSENDMQKKSKWYMSLGDINKGFCIVDDAGQFVSLKIQHDPSLGFGNYYKKLIQDDPLLSDDDVLSDEDNNIKTVYNYAYEFLTGLTDIQLVKFISYFKSKIKIIVTSAPTEAKAFQLFEILNDRGKSLEPMDLIKNMFLKVLNTEGKPKLVLDTFNQNWKTLMGNLELGGKRRISSSAFLKQYIIAYKGENIKTNNLFDYIKKPDTELNTGNKIIDFVDGMAKTSAVFKQIEKGDYSSFNNDQNMYILFKLLGIKQFHPLLMLFYNASDDKKRDLLDGITRLGAAVLFSFTQTNYIEKILPQIIKKYNNTKPKDAERAFDEVIADIDWHINDRASLARDIITNRNFVGRNGNLHTKALMILKFVELYFNRNTKVKAVPVGKKITAEHIQSKNIDVTQYPLDELGFNSMDEKDLYKHRIGNLTLLYNTDNSSVGNKKYDEKLSCYQVSDFVITKTLVEPIVTTVLNGQDTQLFARINAYEKQYQTLNGHWTKGLIETRSKDMAELIFRILTNDFA